MRTRVTTYLAGGDGHARRVGGGQKSTGRRAHDGAVGRLSNRAENGGASGVGASENDDATGRGVARAGSTSAESRGDRGGRAGRVGGGDQRDVLGLGACAGRDRLSGGHAADVGGDGHYHPSGGNSDRPERGRERLAGRVRASAHDQGACSSGLCRGDSGNVGRSRGGIS